MSSSGTSASVAVAAELGVAGSSLVFPLLLCSSFTAPPRWCEFAGRDEPVRWSSKGGRNGAVNVGRALVLSGGRLEREEGASRGLLRMSESFFALDFNPFFLCFRPDLDFSPDAFVSGTAIGWVACMPFTDGVGVLGSLEGGCVVDKDKVH